MVAAWGSAAITARLGMLTARLADGLRDVDVVIPETHVRAPHILSLGFRDGLPQGLVDQLAAENVYVAPRLGRMRITPHVYNDENDVDRFVGTLRRLLAHGSRSARTSHPLSKADA
jgi:selenocysteine lyase/cysteine desulfurase